MKLRVALVALYPAPLRFGDGFASPAPGAKSPGGVRAVVQNLVRGLQAYEDLQIHVIHCHADIPVSTTVEDRNVQVHYLAMPRRRVVPNSLTGIGRVAQVLRQVQPDVVNTHAAHYTLAALRAGYPTIFTIHGVMHREAEVYKSTLFDRARLLLEKWLDSYAVHKVHHIVAISPYVLQEYQDRSPASFHRIDNPLPEEFFSLPNLEQEGRLLYAGTIDERKNVLDLLRALAVVRQKLPDVRLRIAGRTTSLDYNRKTQDFVAAQGLGPNVQFLGLLDSAVLRQEYAQCAAVVLASRQETAPMAVIEAMAAGKPVVATRVGGVPDLVQEGLSGFVVPVGDVEALAQRMVELLTDHDLRHSMGQRARQSAGRFALPAIVAQYRQLYYQVAGRASP